MPGGGDSCGDRIAVPLALSPVRSGPPGAMAERCSCPEGGRQRAVRAVLIAWPVPREYRRQTHVRRAHVAAEDAADRRRGRIRRNSGDDGRATGGDAAHTTPSK